MSGLCGIAHLDGAPVAGGVLRAMTAALAFRGPDRQDFHVEGAAGLGHAWLRTDPDAADERQPLTLDGRAWIAADARIDAQEELRSALGARGRTGLAACSDAALILHAWHAWGEDCVLHLVGDFAFAIWDGARGRLYCARDHFGVKPLFYARLGEAIVFANTLDCVRTHPAVPAALDDFAIADFLLFGMGRDPAATGFAAIRRLPPASYLAASKEGVRLRAYWSPPRDHEVRYRREGDYAEHLRELLQRAVSDRLRARRVAVQMSGGLDSTSVAALARRSLVARARPFDLRAHTIVYDRLVPDEERHYSSVAAAALGIPVRHHAGDDDVLYQRFERHQGRFPEPFHGPDLDVGFDALAGAASDSRVMLTGYDGDTLLEESPKPYLRGLLRRGRIAAAAGAAARYAISQRRFWPLAWAPGRSPQAPAEPAFPAWLEPGLVERLGLRERWRAEHARPSEQHALRPAAHACLAEILRTPLLFDQYDPGVTGLALDVRHPFLDLRVVEYCLALPPEPWCVHKRALRVAMKGILPDAVRLRPKTGLGGWPGARLLLEPSSHWVDRFEPSELLDRYVERRSIPTVCGPGRPLERWRDLRPLTLDRWLRQQSCRSHSTELQHESA